MRRIYINGLEPTHLLALQKSLHEALNAARDEVAKDLDKGWNSTWDVTNYREFRVLRALAREFQTFAAYLNTDNRPLGLATYLVESRRSLLDENLMRLDHDDERFLEVEARRRFVTSVADSSRGEIPSEADLLTLYWEERSRIVNAEKNEREARLAALGSKTDPKTGRGLTSAKVYNALKKIELSLPLVTGADKGRYTRPWNLGPRVHAYQSGTGGIDFRTFVDVTVEPFNGATKYIHEAEGFDPADFAVRLGAADAEADRIKAALQDAGLVVADKGWGDTLDPEAYSTTPSRRLVVTGFAS